MLTKGIKCGGGRGGRNGGLEGGHRGAVRRRLNGGAARWTARGGWREVGRATWRCKTRCDGAGLNPHNVARRSRAYTSLGPSAKGSTIQGHFPLRGPPMLAGGPSHSGSPHLPKQTIAERGNTSQTSVGRSGHGANQIGEPPLGGRPRREDPPRRKNFCPLPGRISSAARALCALCADMRSLAALATPEHKREQQRMRSYPTWGNSKRPPIDRNCSTRAHTSCGHTRIRPFLCDKRQ